MPALVQRAGQIYHYCGDWRDHFTALPEHLDGTLSMIGAKGAIPAVDRTFKVPREVCT